MVLYLIAMIMSHIHHRLDIPYKFVANLLNFLLVFLHNFILLFFINMRSDGRSKLYRFGPKKVSTPLFPQNQVDSRDMDCITYKISLFYAIPYCFRMKKSCLRNKSLTGCLVTSGSM